MTQFEIIMRTDTPELPAEIGNFEEIKAAINEALTQYNTEAIVDGNSIKDAEKTRAHLRKTKEQIETYRKDAKAAYLSKFEKLEAQCKELSSLIGKPIMAIDSKIKDFENAENEKKWQELEQFFAAIGHPDFLKLADIINPKWKNKTMTAGKLREEISAAVCQIEDDFAEIEKMYAQSPLWTAINQRFAETKGNKSAVLVYAAQLERQHAEEQKRAEAIQKAREEQECRQLEEQERAESSENAICGVSNVEAVSLPNNDEPSANRTETASNAMITGKFQVTGTKEQIRALAAFLKKNGIRYEVLK
jgi:hypothetical protein